MSNYQTNIWLISENEFENFTFTGGKVVYIVDEPHPMYRSHPSIITAGALLPPIEAIEAELDGRIMHAISLYEEYLLREETDIFISIIIAAAVKRIPIGIMFGKDELNMQFPKMFMDFIYRHYGLVLGIAGKINPYIEEERIPIDLAKLYCMNIIDYPTFMEKHPNLPICGFCYPKLIAEINPAVKEKTMESYVRYFEDIQRIIHNNGGKFLVDPLEGL